MLTIKPKKMQIRNSDGQFEEFPAILSDVTPEQIEQIEKNKNKLSHLEEQIADYIGEEIPSFWEDSLNIVITTIKALHKEGGKDCFTFPFFSDNHNRLGYAGVLIKKVMEECNIPFCIYGGDSISSAYIADENTMIEQQKAFEKMMKLIEWYCSLGNHDGYWAVSSSEKHSYTRPQNYDLFVRGRTLSNRDMSFGADGTYYYINENASKIRFIFLNTNGGLVDSDQLTWLQNVALKFNESGWGIVFISHQPISNHYNAGISNVQEVITIISNYIDGTDENKAEIVGWYSGHVHRDRIFTGIAVNNTDDTVSGSLPFTQVTITSDYTEIAYESATQHPIRDDNLSHAIDFVTVNKKAKTVIITRLGIGVNRSYSYSNEPVLPSYTNLATTITTDKRLSSSGALSSETGATTVEDYIPVVAGDVIRVKGFGTLGDYNTALYNSSKGVVSVSKATTFSTDASYSYDSSTGVVTLTITGSTVKFIRVSGKLTGTTTDVIITKNEEIV